MSERSSNGSQFGSSYGFGRDPRPSANKEKNSADKCWAWLSLVGRLTVPTLLVDGLELQPFSYHIHLFLVDGPVFFLCLSCFSQSELRGVVIRQKVVCIEESFPK
eukprot:1160433-Pelagomonas_calceolata.AAC.1